MMRCIRHLIVPLLVLAILSGCATTVTTTMQYPAKLDTRGALTISVLPFSPILPPPPFSPEARSLETLSFYLGNAIQDRILNSGFFTVIGSQRVIQSLNQNDTPPCDIYVSGTVYGFQDKLQRNAAGSQDKQQVSFCRTVSGIVSYKIVHSITGEVLDSTQRSFEGKSFSYASPQEVPDALTLVQPDIDTLILNLMRKIEPYTEKRSIALLTSKDKQPAMREALKLARKGYYSLARDAFFVIYQQNKNFEAGYNAARLMEVQGNRKDAATLMQTLYQDTGSEKALAALQQIQNDIQSSEELHRQLEARKQPVQSVYSAEK